MFCKSTDLRLVVSVEYYYNEIKLVILFFIHTTNLDKEPQLVLAKGISIARGEIYEKPVVLGS